MIALRFIAALFVAGAVQAHAADEDQVRQLLETKSCARCDLSEADLGQKNLFQANVAGANLRDANFSGANLGNADLTGARLGGAKLAGVKLISAKLDEVGLEKTDLTEATLTGAQMKNALLTGTQLRGAKLYDVDLEGAVFEPASLPNIESISSAINLKSMTYHDDPTALHQLRKAFKQAGYQDQRSEITYALMHTRRLQAGPIESSATYVLFELTSEWGLSPLRPIWLMLLLIFPFALFYADAIIHPRAAVGIWRVWDKDRICQDTGSANPVRLEKTDSVFWNALYFSFLSSFSVSWHEIDIGAWTGRLNPNEYTLKATGWLRTLSGFQSLVSIFLLALAVLCYFGNPFE